MLFASVAPRGSDERKQQKHARLDFPGLAPGARVQPSLTGRKRGGPPGPKTVTATARFLRSALKGLGRNDNRGATQATGTHMR